MTVEDTALRKLERAITHLEAALTERAQQGGDARLGQIEQENEQLRAALSEAKAAREDLEGRVRDAGKQIDGAINDLRTVLGA